MATAHNASRLDAWRDETDRLNRTPLDVVIPAAFPGSEAVREKQGSGWERWELPDGRKLNVKAAVDGDRFHFHNSADGGGRGAITFLVKSGAAPDFRSARQQVAQIDPAAIAAGAAGHQWKAAQAAQHPKTLFHPRPQPPQQSLRVCLGYLSQERGIDPRVVRAAIQKHLIWADRDGFIVFPHRNPSTQQITGYTRRWPEADREPPLRTTRSGESYRLPTKGVVRGSDSKAGWFSIGRGTETVALVEAPIDAMALMDLLWREGRAENITIRSSGGAAGWTPAMWAGFPHVMIAVDRDAGGDAFEQVIRRGLAPGQTCERLLPPEGLKDWGDVVQRRMHMQQHAAQQPVAEEEEAEAEDEDEFEAE
ncbi:DUF3991 and TOPRIM domain-containing protein [Sulfobacillus harzensis]|uniref:DUF3991 domain-containing protein n=1 Tax=Sulfobacillus harzensis TaxID=2729629 RepID=A0A7Y0L6S7_9FIRM|nr:DUF3991 and TOPRIM domain-containing protein [Sulfobacillus harzensis]NMP23992.1 DUF3991 domain-containing protein [Sulfobacillus harzensis]